MDRGIALENIDRNSYKSLSNRIKLTNDNEWKIIHKHLKQAIKHFVMGYSDSEYFRDCISRTNKVFEGVVEKIYQKAILMLTVNSPLHSIGKKINKLEDENIIPEIFNRKFREYKVLRNEETHEVYRIYSREESNRAIKDAIIFIYMGLEIESLLLEMNPLSEYDILLIYLNTFIESFDEYTNSIKLYYENILGYIYPEKKEVLKSELLDFYNNSVFKDEFQIRNHSVVNKLRPDFEFQYGSITITFSIIKIDESSLMSAASFSQSMKNRLSNYKKTFDRTYYLLWIFTRRKKWVDIICDYFRNDLHYVMFQMKSKKVILEEFKNNYSIDDFYQ